MLEGFTYVAESGLPESAGLLSWLSKHGFSLSPPGSESAVAYYEEGTRVEVDRTVLQKQLQDLRSLRRISFVLWRQDWDSVVCTWTALPDVFTHEYGVSHRDLASSALVAALSDRASDQIEAERLRLWVVDGLGVSSPYEWDSVLAGQGIDVPGVDLLTVPCSYRDRIELLLPEFDFWQTDEYSVCKNPVTLPDLAAVPLTLLRNGRQGELDKR